jgi:hypothetical protein
MRITIAERLRPFSHQPGTFVLLPGSCFRLQIFPTRLLVENLAGAKPQLLREWDLNLKGPVKDFTIQNDLEKGVIRVWGHYLEGYVRYQIVASSDSKDLILSIEKCPEKGIRSDLLEKTLHRKDSLAILKGAWMPVTPFRKVEERLSLGKQKAQDWEMITRRSDLAEIFPFWHRMGKLIPSDVQGAQSEGTLKLLEQCAELVEEKNALAICRAFLNLFQAGFEGMLSPRLTDTQHQGFGIAAPQESFVGSPLLLLSEGGRLISRQFVQAEGRVIRILPVLAPEFHCGRMLSLSFEYGQLDLEWTKKTIRRMIFRSRVSTVLQFSFQKNVKSFRLRSYLKEKGKRILVDEELEFREGTTYYFDNFQK